MLAIEIALLIIAYSLMIVTIFLQFICYKRNLESIETIAFTFSLLLLIMALTGSPFWETAPEPQTTHVSVLLAMILVGLTTPLNVLEERQHHVNAIWKKVLIVIAAILFLATILAYFTYQPIYLQYIVITFLGISVIASMVLVRTSKPKQRIAHREKTERLFAIAFMVLVPLSLAANYLLELRETNLQIGFTIPLVFILLAGNKFWDDLQRLSLLKPSNDAKEQHFKNYALTKREQEIATLLTKGITYKEISESLFISMPTVKTHTSNIYKKCGVKNRSELTALLIK